LVYPDAPGFKASGPSEEAAHAIAEIAPTLRDRVPAAIASAPPGLTADDVACRLNKSILSVRPRVSELHLRGEIRQSGARGNKTVKSWGSVRAAPFFVDMCGHLAPMGNHLLPRHLECGLNVVATNSASMATLSDLVEAVAGVAGLPKPTVFAYGRFARQAGLIGQSGRGRSAAAMTLVDAANLLIAIGGTGVTREAGDAVKAFRSLKNGRCYFFLDSLDIDSDASSLGAGIRFLANYGIRPSQQAGDHSMKIPGDFGSFFEFLIQSTLDGKLAELFHEIPAAEIPSDIWRKWISEKNNSDRHKSMEQLIKEGLVAPYPPAALEFGEHINVEIRFNRLVPSVEIEFIRVWDSPQVVATITFGPPRGGKALGQHRLQLAAGFTQHTLAAVALVVCNMVRASSINSLKAIDQLFADQFQKAASRSEEAKRLKGI
jgi:hypothetical protein